MDIEAYISEASDIMNAALQRKLESKGEALLILTQELEHCRRERDELRNISSNKKFSFREIWSPEKFEYVDSDSFQALKEKNKALFIEIKDLRYKLQEAYSDLKVLRSDRASLRISTNEVTPSKLKEELVQEVEEAKAQIRELKSDLQALLDEKEELVTERDAYRCKVHRLNHEMANLLKLPSPIDIDSILMESKYTKERLKQAQSEIDLAKQSLSKYKGNEESTSKKYALRKSLHDDITSVYFRRSCIGMLDKKKVKGALKLGSGDDQGCRVFTHKQVLEMLEKEESLWRRGMMNKEATVADLRGLCIALVESLQDKSISLAHQKKANRILADRVRYLEEKLAKYEVINPCQLLLDGYSTSKVDSLPPITFDAPENKKEVAEKEEENYNISANEKTNCCDDEEKLPQELEELVNQALLEVQIEDIHP